MIKNLRFDRLESTDNHFYNTERGTCTIENSQFDGFLKCKLIHAAGLSIIVPDLIYLLSNENEFEWIQFYSVLPCILSKLSEEDIIGSIYIDIAFGHVMKITIQNKGHVVNLKDHSNIFKCSIEGPENLMDFATGNGELIDNVPYLNLYHHTSEEYYSLILKSSFFKCSKWNYWHKRIKELLLLLFYFIRCDF